MVFNAIIRNSAIPVVLLYIPKSHQKEDGVMDDNRTISQSIFGHDARIIQGDVIGGSVLVTNNYGTSSQGTDKRDGEDDILRRLYTSPYEDRKDRNPPRVPGTCEWFTSHELFKEWERSDSSRLLWVSADPGCGKSVLVRHLVEYVLQTTESRTVCYFFFKDDFPDQKTVVNALRCILRQLFIQKPLLFSDKISKDQNAGEIICVLDAIDECEDQGSQLAQELCKLYGAANDFHLKFLLTSRPYGNIHRGFRPLEIPGLPVIHLSGESEDEVRKISQEIDIFIRFKVKDIAKRLKLLEEEQNLLLQELMKISHRTYLWVYLTLDLIERDIVVDKTISTAASCIPETVDEAYDRILSKSCDFKQAKKILHIIVAAVRPLTLKEMSFALLLRKSHHSWEDIDLKPEIRFRQELRDVCGLFIVVIDSKIYLLHQTAKEFLLRNNTQQPVEAHERFTWKRSLNLLESHHILSNICIWYLLLLEADAKLFRRVGISYLRDNDRIFLDYSTKYWAIHFREQRIEAQEEKTELILKICDIESRLCQVWFQEYWTSTNTKFPKGFTTLMMTAYFGLQTAVQSLLKIDVDINCQDDTYQRSALSWAARNGFHNIAKLLIRGTRFRLGAIKLPFRKVAEIDLVDIYGRTPLSYAVWDGNMTMVGLLLNAGAVIHVKDEVGGTPMSYAIWNQNEQVIDILLQKGKQVDDDNINDLLFSAAKKGHEEVIELLLKTDKVKLDVKDQEGQTLLLCAVKEAHMAVIKVLLEKGADPNCENELKETPLLYAIDHSNIAIQRAMWN
ncbi:hypothetical protein TRIATDRAFT_321663 [Trichoderma atroviride IMI 206040]|uniref:Uncharacterized protein n=1 Tax=Hypocrea atroviridis (strain ATCC 20476 / IMI 206040) TaxID=452589 RepID=G9P6M4_HYPAI|nr:uncharacterized protein TRIATDRAFT_321663 [Trichoderma atroviride IMI 206040]EHK41445.1 hypothetical protein TRIATDRAFT_321663 [Trichoderma atroviride IMI 206040]